MLIALLTGSVAALVYVPSTMGQKGLKNDDTEKLAKNIGTLACEAARSQLRKKSFKEKLISTCPDDCFGRKIGKFCRLIVLLWTLMGQILARVVKTAFHMPRETFGAFFEGLKTFFCTMSETFQSSLRNFL